MDLDLDAVRLETPAAARVAHFNNAGCSLPPAPVVSAIHRHLDLEAAIGGYEAASDQQVALERVYDEVAALVNCSADEVHLFESGTAAFRAAIQAIEMGSHDNIVVTSGEFGANLELLRQKAARAGAELRFAPDAISGDIDIPRLLDAITSRTRIVSLPIIPANGSVQNSPEIVGKFCANRKVIVVVDACQALGQIPVDVKNLGCGILVFTGRKYLRGPRGTAGMVIRRDIMEELGVACRGFPVTIFNKKRSGGHQVMTPLESREASIAARLGLGVALDYASRFEIDSIAARVESLSQSIRERLKNIRAVQLLDKGTRRTSLISFNLGKIECRLVKSNLRRLGINVGISHRSNTPLDASQRKLPDSLRISPHYYNSSHEIDRLIEALEKLAKED